MSLGCCLERVLKKAGYGDMRALYIVTLIRADLEEVWRCTQDPAEHQRWDLRFTTIQYAAIKPPRESAYL